MTSVNKEIEIKVRIEKPQRLTSFLKKNARLRGVMNQVDEYFVPAHRNFLSAQPIKEWLRLRSENGVYTINYKYFHYNSQGLTTEADEFETRVNDAKQTQRIFKALNFKPIVKVDKTRHSWLYKDYEIGMDAVSNLGTFVEVEFKGRGRDSKKITDGMMAFLRNIGVGKIQRNYQGYPFLLLFPKKVKYHEE